MKIVPFALLRPFWGQVYFRECNDEILELYRRAHSCDRLVAIRRRDGSWHIRRKYRLIYSEKFINNLLAKKISKSFQTVEEA